MAAIVLLIVGALGLVGSVGLFSWKAALCVFFVFVFAAGVVVDLATPKKASADGDAA